MSSEIEITGEVKFTRDMAETLLKYFDNYARDSVVRIEITSFGLWLPNDVMGNRQFLGLAELPRPQFTNKRMRFS